MLLISRICFKMFVVMKMKYNENICKFASGKSNQSLTTYAFVYEKNAPQEPAFRTNDFNTIYFVTQGAGTLATEQGKKRINAGKIFFTFKQIPYKIQNTDNIQYMYITFDGSRAEDLFAHFGITPLNCVFDGYEGLVAFWESSIIKASEKNLDLISESVLYYTLGEMVPSQSTGEQLLLSEIVKYVDENFMDGKLNLTAIATHFGYNSKYLSRVFKDSMGITFSDYLTNARIQHAVFLIKQNVTSVKNIALLSGYKDPLYFSNVFKTKIGVSPKEYIAKTNSANL